MRIPPYAVLASGLLPFAARYAAEVLAKAGYEVASIRGLNINAVAFADAWRAATAAKTTVDVEEQLFRLGTLRPPADVVGAPRLANRHDLDLPAD